MTLFRIFAARKPMRGGPVLPMSAEDQLFWAQRERAAREARARREGRKDAK